MWHLCAFGGEQNNHAIKFLHKAYRKNRIIQKSGLIPQTLILGVIFSAQGLVCQNEYRGEHYTIRLNFKTRWNENTVRTLEVQGFFFTHVDNKPYECLLENRILIYSARSLVLFSITGCNLLFSIFTHLNLLPRMHWQLTGSLTIMLLRIEWKQNTINYILLISLRLFYDSM